MTTGVWVLDPLKDTRWEHLVDRHPRASVFHSRGWFDALHRTYGYEPIVVTTTARGPLENGLVLCRVATLMSRRLVSLPFSDHCDPLLDNPDDFPAIMRFIGQEMKERRSTTLELRPRSVAVPNLPAGISYHLHTLNLTRPAEQIFDSFHRSSTQRAIRRAEREGLTYEAGRSERLLSSFYALLRLTRRRHGLSPQPLEWFRNLVACLGDRLAIHVASDDGLPIASILTLSFKNIMVYKYGGSDERYHRLGGMPFLFWQAIQQAKAQGIEELDLGRSDLDQPGLVAFKDHLGATRSHLIYYTCPERTRVSGEGVMAAAAHRVIAHLPDAAIDFTGRLLYRHLG